MNLKKIKKKDICLFSAPHYFLNQLKNKQNSGKLKIIFKEIWRAKELNSDKNLVAWILNPGQNFIVNEKILKLFPNLRIIITPSTGKNHINLRECQKRKIKVFSLLNDRKNLNSIRSSSEFSFLLLLNSLRKIQNAISEVDKNRWRQNENKMRGVELYEKKVGIIGLGRIGKNLAKWSSNFGAEIAYYDPYVKSKKFKKSGLKNLFLKSDIVCVCCSLNEETFNMITKKHLILLRKNATLLNTARGEIIVEKDLVNTIKKRKDLNITLDVLAREAENKQLNSPLIKLHKKREILITPHISGATIESQYKAAASSLNLLRKNKKYLS